MATVFKTFEEQLATTFGGGPQGTGGQGTSQLQPAKPAGMTATYQSGSTPTTAPAAPAPPTLSAGSQTQLPPPAPSYSAAASAPSSASSAGMAPKPQAPALSPPAGQQQAAAAPPATFAQPGPTKPPAPVIQVRQYTPPPPGQDPYQKLFASFNKQVQQTGGGLQAAASNFTTAAGPLRNWSNVGGEATVRQAMTPQTDTASDQAAVAAAKALLASQYQGPQTLDTTQLAGLQNTQQDIRNRSASLRGLGGVEDLLAQSTAGLSPGEAAFESERLMADPNFRAAAAAADLEASRLGADISGAETQAEAIAKQRAADEADIASQAKGLLTGEQSNISSALDAEIAAEQAKNKTTSDAFAQYEKTGSLEDLAKIPAAARSGGWDPNAFNTQARQTTEEGLKVRQGIMDKYTDIADVPLLEPQITSRGWETTGFPQDWYDQNKGKYSKAEMNQIRQRAQARQDELQAAGFAGKNAAGNRTEVVSDQPYAIPGVTPSQDTKYGLYLPEYFGGSEGDFKPADPRSYTTFDIGVSPSRENLSTDHQRAVFNRISDLLGSAEQLAQAGQPYRAASIAADVKKYLDDEDATLKERRDTLTENQKQWAGQVNDARKQYRESVRKGALGTALGALGAGIGVLLPPVGLLAGSGALGQAGSGIFGGVLGKTIGEK